MANSAIRLHGFKEFADVVCREVDGGYGFIPLIGSGLSVESGIPTGDAMKSYLAACVIDILGWPEGSGTEQARSAAHVSRDPPCEAKWPPLTLQSPREEQVAWASAVVKGIREKTRDGEAIGHEDWIRWEAVGAIAEWRSSLHFLARLYRNPQAGDRLELGAPDYRVKDSFFTHLTRGRNPNVAHLMLIHLAEALHVTTLLTTNFDTLIEEAATQLSCQLVSFEVHERAGLPDPRLVRAERSIVKLHGGRYGLRADFSLDEMPSTTDIDAFCEYFTPGSRTITGQEQHAASAAANLMVMGFSGSDRRIMTLVREGLKSNAIRNVFWICHRRAEADALGGRLRAAGIDEHERIIPTHHGDLGLCMLGLYQRVLYSLPPAGAGFPAFWKVPAEPYVGYGDNTFGDDLERAAEDLEGTIKESLRSASNEGPRVLVCNRPKGLSSIAARAYERASEHCICIWMGLDGYCGPSDVFASLIDTVARKTGASTAISSSAALRGLDKDLKPSETTVAQCRALLRDALEAAHSPVVVFLNARDGFGTNAGATGDEWNSDALYDGLHSLLGGLRHSRLQFVLLLDAGAGNNRARASVREEEMTWQPQTLDGWLDGGHYEYRVLGGVKSWFSIDHVVRMVGEWLVDDPTDVARRRRFLVSLLLCRHARYPSALCTWLTPDQPGISEDTGPETGPPGSLGDRDQELMGIALKYVEGLERAHAIRLKRGGLVWVHNSIRHALLSRLETEGSADGGVAFLELLQESHNSIAAWYVKLFRSSGDPMAALESVYHRVQCIDRCHGLLEKSAQEDVHRIDAMIGASLRESIVTLQLARDSILAAGHLRAHAQVLETTHDMVEKIAGNRGRARDGRAGFSMVALIGELRRAVLELHRDFANAAANFDEVMTRCDHIENDQSGLSLDTEQSEHAMEMVGAVVSSRDGEPPDSREGGSGQAKHAQEPAQVPNPTESPEQNGWANQHDVLLAVGKLAYDRANALTGLRCYELAAGCRGTDRQYGAEDMYGRMFTELELPMPTFDRWPERGTGGSVREAAWKWASAGRSQDQLQLAMRGLRRYMFLQLLRGQASALACSIELPGHEMYVQHWQSDEARKRLEYCTVLYRFCTEAMRFVADHRFLQRENAYLRSHYSAVLSHLGRSYEAERRLSEAAGYLMRSTEADAAVPWAVIQLRRAEVHLDLATRDLLAGGPSSLEKRVVWMDAAHAALTNARRRLAGQRREIWWWCWLYELELMSCVLLSRIHMPYDGNPCRVSMGGKTDVARACMHCGGEYERFIRMHDEARRLVRMDSLRMARYAALYLAFVESEETTNPGKVQHLQESMGPKVLSSLNAAIKERQAVARSYPVDETAQRYIDAVVSRLRSREAVPSGR